MSKKFITISSAVLAVLLFMGINILASGTLTSWRLDATDNKLFTLSKGTTNILHNLQEPITLRYFFSSKLLKDVPNFANYGARVRDMLEEYATASNGKIRLIVTDPEPFTELEDEAVSYGMRQIPLGNSGEIAYFGLAGTNTTDDEVNIPLFQPGKEQALEYELTKMVYQLGNPRDRVIGVISSMPVFGQRDPLRGTTTDAWAALDMLRAEYEIRDLGLNLSYIEPEIDTLLVIHPKSLSDSTLYAIDQFVLKGGKAMIFVDPLAEADQTQPDPTQPTVLPQITSAMPTLFAKWGISFDPEKLAVDRTVALRVQASTPRGPQMLEYLPWMGLEKQNFNRDDFSTNQLTKINLASVGFIEAEKDAVTIMTPLLSTTENSMAMERDAIMFVRDPNVLLDQFKSGEKPLNIAVRVTGQAETAYPEGRPRTEKNGADEKDPTFVSESKGPINLVVVADTDILSDRFWVKFQNFLGTRVPTPIADNAKFLVNNVDILGGNEDLVSLRSRGEYSRPFTRVEDIRLDAEAQFRAQEQALTSKLQETEEKIQQLQQQNSNENEQMLSPEQRREIENFRQEQLKTRKELRAVQHNLNKNIERLGDMLKFINIGLVPILIGLFAVVSFFLKTHHRVQKK